MEQFLRQLQTIPEAAELIRRVEEGGCPAAVSGLQPVRQPGGLRFPAHGKQRGGFAQPQGDPYGAAPP